MDTLTYLLPRLVDVDPLIDLLLIREEQIFLDVTMFP